MDPSGSPIARMSAGVPRRQRLLDTEVAPGHSLTAHTTATRRVGRTCRHVTCTKNPYFGHPGEKAMFCKAHKEEGMIDVKNKQCERVVCMKRGLFGYEGKKARFCGTHRLPGMIDLKNKRCKWVGCSKQATYASSGDATGYFCSAHKSPGMVDVKGRRCESTQCTRRATYGFPGEKSRFCVRHRQDNMVALRQRARAAKGRVTPGTPSSEATDEDTSGAFDEVRGAEAGSEVSKSFAEKWGKLSRQYQLGINTRAGVDGIAVDWGVSPAGVTNAPQNTPGSHVDLLLPAQHRAASPLSNVGDGWYSAAGASSASGAQRNGGLRPSWGTGRTQSLGGSVGPGTVPGDSWQVQNAPLPRLNSGTAWMAHSMDCHAGVGGAGLTPCTQQWNTCGYDASLSSSVAEESVTYSVGPEDLSTSGALPPMMVRSCSALPIASVGGASGSGVGRLSSGVNGDVLPRGSGSHRVPAVMGGSTGGGGDWRPSTPEPRTFTAPQSSADLSGVTAQENILFSPGAGRMDNDLVGTVVASPGNRACGMGASVPGAADPESYEHWLRTLVECSMKKGNDDEDTLSEEPAGESVSSAGSSDKYSSMVFENSQVSHGDPLHQPLGGQQHEFGSGELRSFAKSGISPQFQPPPHQMSMGSGRAISGLSSCDGVGVSACTSFEMSPGLNVSSGSTASCTSSGSSRLATNTIVRSPSTDSTGASPPYETPSELDMTFIKMSQGLRASDGGAVAYTTGNADGGGGASPNTGGSGGSGGSAPCGSSMEGASLNYLWMNFTEATYGGGLH